jgi:hypothetical protein
VSKKNANSHININTNIHRDNGQWIRLPCCFVAIVSDPTQLDTAAIRDEEIIRKMTMIMTTNKTAGFAVLLLLLLLLLTLSPKSTAVAAAAAARGGAQNVFQPAAAVSRITSSSNKNVLLLVPRGGAATAGAVSKKNPNKPKQQQQQQKPKPNPPRASSKALVKKSSTAASSAPLLSLQQVEVLQRSMIAAISCVTTWAMATHHVLLPGEIIFIQNPMQAASVQGLLACALAAIVPRVVPSLVMGVPFCAASFCGAVAGMSAQIATLGDASLLAFLNGVVFYLFERPDHKLQLGKGGRLGTIALLANVVYFGIRNGYEKLPTLVTDIVDRLQPSTTVAVVVAAIVLIMARRGQGVVPKQQQQQQPKQQPKQQQGGVATTNTAVLMTASKGVIVAALLHRLIRDGDTLSAAASKSTLALTLTQSTLAMMAASVAVQKAKPYVILPVAALGLLGATVPFASNLGLAAPILLGAFVGMTSLPPFTLTSSQGIANFLQASFLSAILLQLGLLAGFGGRLGFLAFVGVNFAL